MSGNHSRSLIIDFLVAPQLIKTPGKKQQKKIVTDNLNPNVSVKNVSVKLPTFGRWRLLLREREREEGKEEEKEEGEERHG